MNRIFMLILCVALISKISMAQVINVVKTDGGIEQFSLSDVDNITLNIENSTEDFQKNLRIHTSQGSYQLIVSALDSIYFIDDGNIACFKTTANLHQFNLTDIDSITISNRLDSTVYITYNDVTVSVQNPLELLGVSVEISGADVTVNSTADISNINYVLSGTTSDGMFKIYSDKKLKLHLDNIEIKNSDGPAINIQWCKKITVYLENGTNNIVTDGVAYATPPNEEDQKAAFFSEGQLIFEGTGKLEINGLGEDEHGLGCDDYIEMNGGNIVINSAAKDGVHVNDGFFMNGGSVNITSKGDGIDGGEGTVEITIGDITILNSEDNNNAIKSDSTIFITGGSIDITVQGDQSKGLNSKQDIMLMGGTLNIEMTGGVVLEAFGSGFDPSYCTAIKADNEVLIDLCAITITTTGEAGRGISCNSDISMNSGTLQITSNGDGNKYTNQSGEADAYHGPCINADGNLNLTGGKITLNHSGNAGKGIATDGQINIGTAVSIPIIDITTSGRSVTIASGGYHEDEESAEAKAISADGAITIENSDMKISSADDGIKSKESITVNDGIINITNSVEGIESPNIFFNGGEINVKARDDALNATSGSDPDRYDGSNLTVNGGYIFVNALEGDALDSNGDIFINGGIIVAHGPQSSEEVSMDVNGDCIVGGGFLVASGTNSDMTEGPDRSSTQYSVLLRTNQGVNAGTIFHIEDASGNSLLTFAPMRRYYSIIFTAPELSRESTYSVFTGGSSTGTLVNGLYTGGTYSGGTLRTTFTLTDMAQTGWF